MKPATINSKKMKDAFLYLFLALALALSSCGKVGVPDSTLDGTYDVRWSEHMDTDGYIVNLDCGEYAEVTWGSPDQEVMIVMKTDCDNLSVGKIYSGKDGSMIVKPSWSTMLDSDDKRWYVYGTLMKLKRNQKILLSCGRETGGTCKFEIYTPHRGTGHGSLFTAFPVTIAYIACDADWKTVFTNEGGHERKFRFWCKPCENSAPEVRIRMGSSTRTVKAMTLDPNHPGEYNVTVPAESGTKVQLRCPGGTGECQFQISIDS